MPAYVIGLIGYGGFGRFLHRAWSELDGIAVRAISDENPPAGLTGVTFYPNWRDLVADPDIDIVAIATPPHAHAEMACVAMEAGKHVLIEKPLATTLEDAQRVIEVRDRTGRRAAVDYVLRFNPIVEALEAWARNGWFGPLRRVLVENYAQDEALPPEHWFWDGERSGGILVEHAVHFIDLTNACALGKPERVEGFGLRRTSQQEDRVLLTTVYGGGLVATQYHEFARPRFFERTSMRFVFDLAEVDLEGWVPLSGRVRALTSAPTRDRLALFTGFEVTGVHPIGDVEGAAGRSEGIRVGGVAYGVDTVVEGTFALPGSKEEAYASLARAALVDLTRAVEDPGYQPRISLEAGAAGLEVALEAFEKERVEARGRPVEGPKQ